MKKKSGIHTIDVLFPLIFILFFCLCALLVVLQGARIYEETALGLQENYTVRTAVSYLKEKIRECGSDSEMEILDLEGRQVLVIREEIKGERYGTYIYLEEGKLKELYIKDNNFSGLCGGQPLVELDSFSASVAGENIVLFEVGRKGQTESVYIRLEG